MFHLIKTMAPAKIVFLYTELAGYFLACVEALSQTAEVLIVRWPVNKEAPFEFTSSSRVQLLDRKTFTDAQLIATVKEFKPDMLICSGWVDKGYLKVARSFQKKIPVVVSLDNHWTGSLKQRLACLTAPLYIRRLFTHAWVPGRPQEVFAKKLGFGDSILHHFYCADTALFDGVYKRTRASKEEQFPHRFLYVARYVEHKGIFELWEAFTQLSKELDHDWELWCIGTGDQWEKRVLHEKIHHLGFVQPRELEPYIAQTGVYVLPSKFEPWGVTVQEFATCGFPLLVSDQVGSRTFFLKENGLEFEAGKVSAIKAAMREIMLKSDADLLAMGKRSHELGVSLTPEKWVDNLLGLLKR